MKLSAHFEDGVLSLKLVTESKAEQKMIGALLDQPQADQGSGYLDKSLISASLRYEGHWTNQNISSVTMNIYKPNEDKQNKPEAA